MPSDGRETQPQWTWPAADVTFDQQLRPAVSGLVNQWSGMRGMDTDLSDFNESAAPILFHVQIEPLMLDLQHFRGQLLLPGLGHLTCGMRRFRDKGQSGTAGHTRARVGR